MNRYLFLLVGLLLMLSACNDDNYFTTTETIFPEEPTVIEVENTFLTYARSNGDLILLDGIAKRRLESDDVSFNLAIGSGGITCSSNGLDPYYDLADDYPRVDAEFFFFDGNLTTGLTYMVLSDLFEGEPRAPISYLPNLYECGDYQQPITEITELTEDYVAGNIQGDFFYMLDPADFPEPDDWTACPNWIVVEDVEIEFALPYTDC
ncbi:MAG: hypothetical protein AAGJ82_08335 [Bacteroidota bacterium]